MCPITRFIISKLDNRKIFLKILLEHIRWVKVTDLSINEDYCVVIFNLSNSLLKIRGRLT